MAEGQASVQVPSTFCPDCAQWPDGALVFAGPWLNHALFAYCEGASHIRLDLKDVVPALFPWIMRVDWMLSLVVVGCLRW